MSDINIPKRRPISLFDDPDLDARYAREMQRYREVVAAGKPYSPGSGMGLVETLFGAGEALFRDTAATEFAPPIEKGNALPELLPEREEDPHDETSAPASAPPDATATDAVHRLLRPRDRLAEQTGNDTKPSTPKPNPAPTVYTEGKKVVYVYADGTKELREGGTRSWRNNNPGNIKYARGEEGFAARHGAIGQAEGFAIFPTEAAGREALNALLHSPGFQVRTLDKLIENYAPPNENDTAAYQAFVRKQLGVPGDTRLSNLSPQQMALLEKSIIRFEGWQAGPGKVLFGPGK